MAKYGPKNIKNICIVGHGDSGKTTLADIIMYKAGATKRQGHVKDHTSLFDFDEMEKEKLHSIDSAIGRCEWEGNRIQVIDTPGYPDYIADAIGAIAACEGVIVCVNAANGVEVTTRRVMRAAEKLGRARMIVITKCDLPDLDMHAIIDEIRTWFGDVCIPITLPTGMGADFDVPVRLLRTKGGDTEEGQNYYQNFVESAVEVDDEVVTRYLDGEEIGAEDLKRCFIKAVADGKLVPIIFSSVEKDVGGRSVLDAVTDLFPSAAHAKTISVYKDEDCSGEKEERPLTEEEPFLGQIFKLTVDRHVGKIAFLRIYSGKLRSGDYFYHAEGGRKEKIGHIAAPMGKEMVPKDDGVAGEIVALTKIDSLSIGDTISANEDCGFLPKIVFPKPMAEVSVRPKSRADETKISEAFHKLCDEIPTFTVRHRASTNETIAAGMSALHLETTFRRLKDRYGIEVETAVAKVPYHEAITCAADGHYRHKKQSGGRGQFGEVFLRIEPAEEGTGLDFQWKVVGGAIPTNFAPAIEKGIREKMSQGVIAGHPLNDVRVFIMDGKYHDVDSSEAAFKIAGGRAFSDAVSKARPALLEPIVEAEIIVPSEHMGDISGDLNTRRGRIHGMETKGMMQVLVAHVPRSEMAEYPRVITALTHGEGSFSYEPCGYEQVPANVQKQVMAAFQPQEEEH